MLGCPLSQGLKKPLEAAVLLFQTNISLSTRRGNPKLSPFLPEKLVPVPFVTSHGSIPELSIAAIFFYLFFFKSEQIVDDWWVNWQAGDSIAKKKKKALLWFLPMKQLYVCASGSWRQRYTILPLIYLVYRLVGLSFGAEGVKTKICGEKMQQSMYLIPLSIAATWCPKRHIPVWVV